MTNENIFAEEWRDCLRAHYRYVVRQRDEVTMRSLVQVMHEVGFSDDDLRALYVEATLRADDLDPDFLPDLSRFQVAAMPVSAAPPASEPEPEPETPVELAPEAESVDDPVALEASAESDEIAPDASAEPDAIAPETDAADDHDEGRDAAIPPAPTQLSLF